MRLLGALLIFTAFFAGGVIKTCALKSELHTLRGMIRLTELMKNEIVARRTRLLTLAVLLCDASDNYTERFTNIFREELQGLGEKSLSDIWRTSVNSGLTALPNDCRAALSELGGSIGRYDVELQQAAFERCAEKLSDIEKQLTASYSANRKMYLGVFGGTGLIAFILLL